MKLWIARNKNKTIYAYDAIPIRNEDKKRFEARGKYTIYFPDNFFKELTWENSPQEVELKLKNELSFEEMEELIDDLI